MGPKEFAQVAAAIRPRLVAQSARMLGNEDDADDIAQDTLLRLWQMRDRLDAYRTVEGLAFVIARNLALDRLRKPGVSRLEDAPEPIAPGSADASLAADDARRQWDEVMARLVDSHRAVIQMRHVDGMEMEDIARVLGTNANNVRVLLSRARANVKKIFLNRNNI